MSWFRIIFISVFNNIIKSIICNRNKIEDRDKNYSKSRHILKRKLHFFFWFYYSSLLTDSLKGYLYFKKNRSWMNKSLILRQEFLNLSLLRALRIAAKAKVHFFVYYRFLKIRVNNKRSTRKKPNPYRLKLLYLRIIDDFELVNRGISLCSFLFWLSHACLNE